LILVFRELVATLLYRWMAVWPILLMKDVDHHPSEFVEELLVHRQQSVDSCTPDHRVAFEGASSDLQVMCAAAVHYTVHLSASEDESSVPQSAFVDSGTSDRREGYGDASPVVVGPADAASDRHLTDHHWVSVAVVAGCQSTECRLLVYHRLESDCRPCETVS